MLRLPNEGFALLCWGLGSLGLKFLGSMPWFGALGSLVDGGGVGESGASQLHKHANLKTA